jgi:hypothetical protein
LTDHRTLPQEALAQIDAARELTAKVLAAQHSALARSAQYGRELLEHVESAREECHQTRDALAEARADMADLRTACGRGPVPLLRLFAPLTCEVCEEEISPDDVGAVIVHAQQVMVICLPCCNELHEEAEDEDDADEDAC